MAITPPEPYAVYALELTRPSSVSEAKQRAKDRIGMAPGHVRRAAKSYPILYVGMTGRMPERLLEHLEGGDEAADATAIFPPNAIYKIEWFESYREAEIREQGLARDLREGYPDGFTYQY